MGGSLDGKLLRADILLKGTSCSTDITEFLWKAGQGEQILKVRHFSRNALHRILAKAGLCEDGRGKPGGGAVKQGTQRFLTTVWARGQSSSSSSARSMKAACASI